MLIIMADNGPSGMYKLNPVYTFPQDIILPDCMYKIANICEKDQSPSNENQEENKLAELEKHQEQILKRLELLKEQVLQMKNELGVQEHVFEKPKVFQDIVVKANPKYPPLSVWAFYQLLSKKMQVRLVTYIHSSLIEVPQTVDGLKGMACPEPHDLSLTVIWKNTGKDPEMMISPINQGAIEGEVNIARYIARLLQFGYEEGSPETATQIDQWLEMAHASVLHGNSKERQATIRNMNSHLGMNSHLVGSALSLADIVMWSAIIQTKLHQSLPANVSKWWKSLNNTEIFQMPGAMILN